VIEAVAIVPAPARVGTLDIQSTADGVHVSARALNVPRHPSAAPSVDLGPLPVSASLEPGTWELSIDSPGYEPWSRQVNILAGGHTSLVVEPELISGAWLEVRAVSEDEVDAVLSLDGDLVCTLPCRVMVEPGSRQLEIVKRRYKPLAVVLDVVQADEIHLDVTLEPATSRAPAVVTGAVGLVTLGTAVVFTVRAARTRRALAADIEVDERDPRIVDRRRDMAVAGAMYGVSAAIGALTLFYLLRQPGVASRAGMKRWNLAGRELWWRVGPEVGPTVVGVGGEIRF